MNNAVLSNLRTSVAIRNDLDPSIGMQSGVSRRDRGCLEQCLAHALEVGLVLQSDAAERGAAAAGWMQSEIAALYPIHPGIVVDQAVIAI